MSFDIAAMEVADTFDVEILNPKTGEPLIGDDEKPCTVTVYGPGTKQFAAARSKASNKTMKRLRTKGKLDTSADEDLAATASFLTEITAAFNGFTYKDGEQGEAMFRACYLDARMGWLTDQVNTGAGDWGNFTPELPSS